MSNGVVLRTYPDRLHAELARSFLESEGIESFVASPSNLPGSFLIAEWGDGMIPHELKVAEEDLRAAEQALADTESGLHQEDWDADEASGEERQDGNSPETSPAPMLDDSVCSTCRRDKNEDDPGYARVRFWMVAGFVVYFAIAIGVPIASSFTLNLGEEYFVVIHLQNWLVLVSAILFAAYLLMRGYLIRHRCGGCGRYRSG